MSADRFSFLEFEEEGAAPAPSVRDTDAEPAARDITAEPLADGTRLAEVRLPNPRGYRHTRNGLEEDDEEEGVSLRSMAAPKAQKPLRLRPVEVFGERGLGAGQFSYPAGLAVDREGVLFVADSYAHRLQRITPGGGVAIIGGPGSGRGQFGSPQGVATDEEDAFYVVEQSNCRVQKFTREGMIALVFGKPGKAPGELHGPTAITVSPTNGDIFVADTGNSRVQRFDAAGRFLNVLGLNVLGSSGPDRLALSRPQAVAASPGGSLHVADAAAGRILRFDPLGRPDRQFGPAPVGRGRGMAMENPASARCASRVRWPWTAWACCMWPTRASRTPITGETRGACALPGRSPTAPCWRRWKKLGARWGPCCAPAAWPSAAPSRWGRAGATCTSPTL